MKNFDRRLFQTILVILAFTNTIRSDANDTLSSQNRKGRVNGRIVKLYSGVRPDPILCHEEGFKADPVNCAVFYRCTKTSRGKFTVYRFQCGPGTVYDPDTEVCNHPMNTKRSECGGLIPTAEKEDENEVEDQELPSPIKTTSSSIGSFPSTSTMKITEQFVDYKPVTTVSYPSVTPVRQELVENSNNFQSYPGFDVKNETQNVAMTFTTMVPNPEKSSCISDGFIGDSENCRKFYRCVSNSRGGFIQYEFFCSESTVWDDNIQSCNHAWAVKNRRCGRGDFSSNNSGFATDQSSGMSLQNNDVQNNNIQNNNEDLATEQQTYNNFDRSKEEFVQYGNKINYEKHTKHPENIYTTTSPAHQETLFSSSPGHFYDKYEETDIKGANYDINEINHYHTTTSRYFLNNFQQNYTTSDARIKKNVQCTESGFMADPVDCKKFYRCVDNGKGGYTKFDFSCSSDTVWDRKQEVCNHAWAVKDCGGIVSAEDSNSQVATNNPIKTSTTEESFQEGYGNQINQESSNSQTTASSSIIEEKNEEGYGNQIHQGSSNVQTTSSPSITVENNEDGYGNLINQESNNIQTTSSTVLTTISLLSTTESSKVTDTECTSDGFFGDVNDCQKFYRCINNGRSFTRYNYVCGDGTLWDQSIQACNHAWAVNSCNQSTVVSSTPQSTSAHYTSLTTTISYKETTANEDSDSGDDNSGYYSHQSTTASKQPVSMSETTTLKSQQIQQTDCQSSGFMGDANDCTKFYRCVDNGNGGYTRYEFSCGDNTVWDAEIEACNHAWAVKQCGGVSSTTEELSSHTTNNNLDNGHTSSIYSTLSSSQMSTTHLQTTTKTTTIMSENNLCETSGFMGDKSDCKKFYRCVDDGDGKYIRYDFSCGDGTLWDSKIQACNHAWAVEDCGNSIHTQTTPNNNEESTKPSTTSSSEYEHVTLTTTEKDIPVSVTSSSSSIVTTTAISSKQECQSIGFMGDQNNCKIFYRCVDNGSGGFTKYEFSCGEGTAWDSKIEACNHESAVQNCSNIHSETQSEATTSFMQPPLTTTPSNNVITQTQQSQTPSYSSTTTLIDVEQQRPSTNNECTSDGFFANVNDCKRFFRCVNDGKGGYTKYEFSCADGTVWVQEIQSCDHQTDNVSCSSFSSTVSTEKPEISSSSENTISHATVNSESQTNENLDNNTPILQDEQGSETQSNMSTANSTSSSSSSSTTESTSSTSRNECSEDGYFGNVEDCKKFYRCVSNDKGNFTKYDYICGEGTIWDQDITACNHPQDVTNRSCKSDQESSSTTVSGSSQSTSDNTLTSSESSASISSESTTSKNEINSTSASNENSSENYNDKNITCKKAGFYANPNDCKKFYRCVDWDSNGEKFSIFHFECGEGTIWDPSLDTCNHADSVYPPRNCNGTLQQNENTTEPSETTEKATTTTNQETTTSESDSTTQEVTTTQKSTTQQSSSQQTTTESTTQQQSTIQETTAQQETTTLQTTTQQQITEQQTTTQQQSTTEQQTTTQQSSTSTETAQESTTQPSTTEKPTTQQPIATSTDQTSTQTTQEQTTVSESNNVSTTTESSEQSSTTGEILTSTQPLTTEENISQTEASTTENQQQSTTESNVANQECPETEEDQFVLVCPTSFKRHPKYCNLFYQCTEDNDSHEIKTATFSCPNNTIYDETKVQCVEEDKSDKKCEGQIAQRHRVKRLGIINNEPIVVTRDIMACPSIGHFPLEKSEECSTVFLKCELTKAQKLRGYIYKCPEGFVYWKISRKCESLRKLRECKNPIYEWTRRHDIPVEKHNVAS